MSIIYVASIGQTAATKRYYWDDAKERFRYTESVLICGENLVENVSRFLDENANLVIIENPFFGTDGYVKAVEDIAKQVMDIITAHHNKGHMIDEVIVNTAGGTEKMSCIIKDAVDIIKQLFPYVTHVWGATHGYKTVYTVKPNINFEDIKSKIEHQCSKKQVVEEDSPEVEKIKDIIPYPVFKEVMPAVEPVDVAVKKATQASPKKPKTKKSTLDPKVSAEKQEAERKRKQRKEEKRLKREELRKQKHIERMKEVKAHKKYKKKEDKTKKSLFTEFVGALKEKVNKDDEEKGLFAEFVDALEQGDKKILKKKKNKEAEKSSLLSDFIDLLFS